MQDTFQWTDESVSEFIMERFVRFSSEFMQMHIDEFKSSKSPKKEWEIVAVRSERFNNEIRQLLEGAYFEGGYDKPDRGWQIHSVRRLPDGEVFSVGDKLKAWAFQSGVTINGFVIENGRLMLNHSAGGEYRELEVLINELQKLPQPILTTVDGVEIFPGDTCSFVFDDWTIYLGVDYNFWKPRFDGLAWKDFKAFSTLEAAEAYILENKPMLSLNDVKEVLDKFAPWSLDAFVVQLTALVKQKLNQ